MAIRMNGMWVLEWGVICFSGDCLVVVVSNCRHIYTCFLAELILLLYIVTSFLLNQFVFDYFEK